MTNNSDEYLIEYRKFVEKLLSHVNVEDQLPVKVAGYNITKSELVGTTLDWTFQFLNQWNCPQSLLISIGKLVLKEIKQLTDADPKSCGYDDIREEFESLKLMKVVIQKVIEICNRLKNDEVLSSLPPPENNRFVSWYSMKNLRRFMEDRYIRIDDLHKLFDLEDCGPIGYYAIFDGHNGQDAAAYSVAHLHQYLIESKNYPSNPREALTEAFLRTDNDFLQKCTRQKLRSGSTALCVLIHYKEKMLYTAWAGDSEAILVRKGQVTQLVKPHKAERMDERDRIEKSGGQVLFWSMTWRVYGQLAVSRAIGNQEYKPHVTSEPDIVSIPLSGDEDFVVLACDGLWDHVTPEVAAKTVYEDILESKGKDLNSPSVKLIQLARQNSSEDNISVIVAFLSKPTEIASFANSVLTAMETTTATQQSSFGTNTVTQNGGTNYHPSSPSPPPSLKNFNKTAAHFGTASNAGIIDDEDDYGPETDVDTLDEAAAAHVLAAENNNNSAFEQITKQNNSDKSPFEDGAEHINSLDTSGKDISVNNNNNIDDGSISEDSDAEDWKFYQGNKENRENNESSKPPVSLNGGELLDDMSYSLNPDAAPFVPTSPLSGRSKESSSSNEDSPLSPSNKYMSETRDRVLQDEIISSSPMKGCEKSLDNVVVPSPDEFQNEICKRPSDISPDFDASHLENNLSVFNTSVNSADHDISATTLLGLSTKAVFGDESSTYADNLAEINKDLGEKEHKRSIFDAFEKEEFATKKKAAMDEIKAEFVEKDITSESSTTMSVSTEDVANAVEKQTNNEEHKAHEYSFGDDSNLTLGSSNVGDDLLGDNSVVAAPEISSVSNSSNDFQSGFFNSAVKDYGKQHADETGISELSFDNYRSMIVDDGNSAAYLTSFKDRAPSHLLDFTDKENPIIKPNSNGGTDDESAEPAISGSRQEVVGDDKTRTDNNAVPGEEQYLTDAYYEYNDKNIKNEKNLEIGGKRSTVAEEFDERFSNAQRADSLSVVSEELNESRDLLGTAFEKASNDHSADFGSSAVNELDSFHGFDDFGKNRATHLIENNSSLAEEAKFDEKTDEVAENIDKDVKEADHHHHLAFSTVGEQILQFKDYVDFTAPPPPPPDSSSSATNPFIATVGDFEIAKLDSDNSHHRNFAEPTTDTSLETMIYKGGDDNQKEDFSDERRYHDDDDDDDQTRHHAPALHKPDSVEEPLVSSFDAQTPYKHDCSRINAEDPITECHYSDLKPRTLDDFDTTSIKPDLTSDLETKPNLLSGKLNAAIVDDPYQSMFYNDMPESDFKRNDVSNGYVDADKPESDLELKEDEEEPLAVDNSLASDQDSTYPLSPEQTHISSFSVTANAGVVDGRQLYEQNKELVKEVEDLIVDSIGKKVDQPPSQADHESDAEVDKLCSTPPPTPVPSAEEREQKLLIENGAIETESDQHQPPSSRQLHDEPVDEVKVAVVVAEAPESEDDKKTLPSSVAVDEQPSKELSSTAAVVAAGVATAAVATAAVAAIAIDAKKTTASSKVSSSGPSTTKKPLPSKSSSKPGVTATSKAAATTAASRPKSSTTASSAAATTTKKPATASLAASKPAATKTQTTTATSTTRSLSASGKQSLTATKPTVPSAKLPLSTKPKPPSSFSSSVDKKSSPVVSSSTVAKTTSLSRPATAPAKSAKSPTSAVANGDIAGKFAAKSTSAIKKSSPLVTKTTSATKPASATSSPTTTTSATKSSITLATRTSLAPKARAATKPAALNNNTATSNNRSAPKSASSSPLDKKTPVTGVSKETDKKSTTKRVPLSGRPLTSRPLSTSKTDSKSNATAPAKKMAGSATAVAIRKPSSVGSAGSSASANQTIEQQPAPVEKQQNGEIKVE